MVADKSMKNVKHFHFKQFAMYHTAILRSGPIKYLRGTTISCTVFPFPLMCKYLNTCAMCNRWIIV